MLYLHNENPTTVTMNKLKLHIYQGGMSAKT